MVIIDTSIWVPALRRKESFEKDYVAKLVARGEAGLVGLVMAEVLRGATSQADFDRLSEDLSGAEFIDSDEETWRWTGEVMLDLRLRGETIPLQDAIIAAHGLQGNHEIYSTDAHFRRVTGVRLHVPI